MHSESQRPETNCPLCKSNISKILTQQLRRGNGVVRLCASCDHGYLTHDQSVDAKEYYGELYRQEYSHNAAVASTDAKEIFEVYKNYQQARLDHILPLLNSDTRLLEVGASAGQFLTHVIDKVSEVRAVELDKDCCAFLRKHFDIDVEAEFLENSRFASETFDVVCAFQVIEHVEKPVDFLKTIRRSTKKGGVIFIEVPNLRDPLLSVWDISEYQKFFYHSAHLHYFTEKSLGSAALAAGFRPEQIEINFTQDYNVLNHLHWVMNNGPQADCHIGLSKIDLRGRHPEIAIWLTEEMRTLNRKYIAKLIEAKCTSNMLMKLHND